MRTGAGCGWHRAAATTSTWGRRGARFVQLFLLISGLATAILLAGLLLLLMLAVWLVVDLFLIPGNVREWSENKRLALMTAMRAQPA